MDSLEDKAYNGQDSVLDMGRGCELCGCGTESVSAAVHEGCFKLHVTDWLGDYPDNLPNDIYEVRFKNTRRSYYRNVNGLNLKVGDIVAVEASPGHDIGIVSLSGDMVARQMRRVGFNPQNGEFKKIYRKAKPYDIEKWQEAIALEHGTMIKARQIAADMNLNMKIGDVEYQGDKIKAIFYYIADERVDFRELIKVFAEVFHIRVEMKQIGARQEAGRIGGIGSCGRELCCASWISSFMSVTTNAARMQDLSLNPQKLAGQCSKLKCCMLYEYDDYMDARRDFPKITAPLQVADGEYYHAGNDILARTMNFSREQGTMTGLVTIPVSRVIEILKLNSRGIKPEKLEGVATVHRGDEEPGFVNVIGEDSITRFDERKGRRQGRDRRGDRQGRRGGEDRQQRESSMQAERPSEDNRRRGDRGGNGGMQGNNNRKRGQEQQSAESNGGNRRQERNNDNRQKQQGQQRQWRADRREAGQQGQAGGEKGDVKAAPQGDRRGDNNRRGGYNRRQWQDGQRRKSDGGKSSPEPKGEE